MSRAGEWGARDGYVCQAGQYLDGGSEVAGPSDESQVRTRVVAERAEFVRGAGVGLVPFEAVSRDGAPVCCLADVIQVGRERGDAEQPPAQRALLSGNGGYVVRRRCDEPGSSTTGDDPFDSSPAGTPACGNMQRCQVVHLVYDVEALPCGEGTQRRECHDGCGGVVADGVEHNVGASVLVWVHGERCGASRDVGSSLGGGVVMVSAAFLVIATGSGG